MLFRSQTYKSIIIDINYKNYNYIRSLYFTVINIFDPICFQLICFDFNTEHDEV